MAINERCSHTRFELSTSLHSHRMASDGVGHHSLFDAIGNDLDKAIVQRQATLNRRCRYHSGGAPLSEFGAWLPGWRPFLSWKGRIGRRTFLGSYVALCFVSGVLGMLGAGIPAILGATDVGIPVAIAFAVIGLGMIPVSALFAQRAHDIGWSAFVPLAVFAVLAAPMLSSMVITFDAVTGMFGYVLAGAAHAAGVDMVRLFPMALLGNGLWMMFAIFMFVRKGQLETNRFGPPPAALTAIA